MLQSILNRSYAAKLLAIRRTTENRGKRTTGIDGQIWDTPKSKYDAINQLAIKGYRPLAVRRVKILKTNGKLRPLGIPTIRDRSMQGLFLLGLAPISETLADHHSYGFRPYRSCADAIEQCFIVLAHKRSPSHILEGDIRGCFDKIHHGVLVNILKEHFQDNRFLRLMQGLLNAGYLEDWKFETTYSGVPQGSIIGPILSNIVLDRLDKYAEQQLIPAYTRGQRRKTYPPYVKLTMRAWSARQKGDWELAVKLRKQAQTMPSRDPKDPNFRRLWYTRYADDFLLGFTGTKQEAEQIKQQLKAFIQNELKLELNEDKTLITHAREEKARFLGYEVHVLHENRKHHSQRKQRCINGSIGLRIPMQVKRKYLTKYMRKGKPIHLAPRISNDVYSTIAQYQSEYRGIVQYYQMAYNLHTLSKLKFTTEVSLVKTLASKFKTTCTKIYRKYGKVIATPDGDRKVILVEVKRKAPKKPLVAYFGAISLKWNRWVAINDHPARLIWNRRSQVVDRLLAQKCELCGSKHKIEVHHVRKLSDLQKKGKQQYPRWKKIMIARQRKTLVVCQSCHNKIHYGQYDGKSLR